MCIECIYSYLTSNQHLTIIMDLQEFKFGKSQTAEMSSPESCFIILLARQVRSARNRCGRLGAMATLLFTIVLAEEVKLWKCSYTGFT